MHHEHEHIHLSEEHRVSGEWFSFDIRMSSTGELGIDRSFEYRMISTDERGIDCSFEHGMISTDERGIEFSFDIRMISTGISNHVRSKITVEMVL